MPALIAFLKLKWLLPLLRQFFVFVLPYVLEWIKDKIVDYFKRAKQLREDVKKENEARKKYEAIVKDPNSTLEEKDRAKAEFLNS